MFFKIVILKNFAKLSKKHLYWSLFLNKVIGGAWNFIEKETLVEVFSYKFCEIFINTFLAEHLLTTTSESLFYTGLKSFKIR